MARKKRTAKRRYTIARYTPAKRIRRRKRGLMSGAGIAGITGAVKNTAEGIIGGIIGLIIAKPFSSNDPSGNKKIIAGLIASIAAAMIIKRPILAAGIAGGTALGIAPKLPFLNDEANFVPADTLISDENLPDLVSPDGSNWYFPLQDGNFFPLNDYQASVYNAYKQAGPDMSPQRALVNRPGSSFNQVFPGYLNPGAY